MIARMISRAVIVAAVCAGSAAAQSTVLTSDFNGDWTAGDPSQCVLFRDDPNFAFRIQDGLFQGLESSCDMNNPVGVLGMGALLFDMECVGEGENWDYRALFMQDGPDHLVFLTDGSSVTLQRCTSSDVPAAALPSK